jgi:hypothetical protein
LNFSRIVMVRGFEPFTCSDDAEAASSTHSPHQTGGIVSITSSARASPTGTRLGRRRVEPDVEAKILELKASGDGILKIGRKPSIGTSAAHFQARAAAIVTGYSGI